MQPFERLEDKLDRCGNILGTKEVEHLVRYLIRGEAIDFLHIVLHLLGR